MCFPLHLLWLRIQIVLVILLSFFLLLGARFVRISLLISFRPSCGEVLWLVLLLLCAPIHRLPVTLDEIIPDLRHFIKDHFSVDSSAERKLIEGGRILGFLEDVLHYNHIDLIWGVHFLVFLQFLYPLLLDIVFQCLNWKKCRVDLTLHALTFTGISNGCGLLCLCLLKLCQFRTS